MVLFILAAPVASFAQEGELIRDITTTAKARVVRVISHTDETIPGTTVQAGVQRLEVEVLDGPEKGKTVELDNDRVMLEEGDTFYLSHTQNSYESRDYYSVTEPYRLHWLVGFIGLFALCVIYFGGLQGLRGLASLLGSFLLILYVMLPGILHGYSPILMSMGVASLIIVLGSYITHGFSKMTTTAVIGMIATVIATGVIAYVGVYATKLSGFDSEEAVYLNFNTGGVIDFQGLLLGGILIGLLGVLYDAAIGQSLAVEELHRIAPHVPRTTIYSRAIRMGREHIGALVNTLAIAYVGASLPLLLLFYSSATSTLGVTISREVFATEIIRTMVGSIGLVLTVPITTWIAVLMLVRRKKDVDEAVLGQELHALEHAGAGHSHMHVHHH